MDVALAHPEPSYDLHMTLTDNVNLSARGNVLLARHISVDFQQLHPRRMSTVSNIFIRHLRRAKRFSAVMMVVFRSLWSYHRLLRTANRRDSSAPNGCMPFVPRVLRLWIFALR